MNRWSWQALRQAAAERNFLSRRKADAIKCLLCKNLLARPCHNPAQALHALARFGIMGLGYGQKISSKRPAESHCIRVYVRKKKPRVPRRLRIPTDVDGILTDVIELPALGFTTAFGGDFIGLGNVAEGTFGCIVKRNHRYYILSNNHVIANNNQAMIGSPVFWRSDAVSSWQAIGELSDFVPIDFGGINDVDAAIAYLPNPSLASPQIDKIGRISDLPATPYSGMVVKKSGAATNLTFGVVEGYAEDFNVPIGNRLVTFRGQLGIQNQGEAFTAPGDSGSLVLTADTNQPIGLHFMTDPAMGLNFCTPIGVVLKRLGVELVSTT